MEKVKNNKWNLIISMVNAVRKCCKPKGQTEIKKKEKRK